MYPQDFPVERLTPVIDLPMILAGLVILALAVAAGYAFARLNVRSRSPSPRDVAASIHLAIQKKLNAALAAHGGATSNAAQALVDEVEARLGDVFALTGDLGKTSSSLRDALAGKRKPGPPAPAVPSPPAAVPHAVIIPIPGQGGGVSAAAGAHAGGTAVAEANAPEGGLIGAVLTLPPTPPPVSPPPPLSSAEQIAAVRAAIEAFAVLWGTTKEDPASSARIDALEAAARQLSVKIG